MSTFFSLSYCFLSRKKVEAEMDNLKGIKENLKRDTDTLDLSLIRSELEQVSLSPSK